MKTKELFNDPNNDLEKQKELLKSHIGEQIVYNNIVYYLLDFFESTINDDLKISCILNKQMFIIHNPPLKDSLIVPISEIFKIYYPQFTKY